MNRFWGVGSKLYQLVGPPKETFTQKTMKSIYQTSSAIAETQPIQDHPSPWWRVKEVWGTIRTWVWSNPLTYTLVAFFPAAGHCFRQLSVSTVILLTIAKKNITKFGSFLGHSTSPGSQLVPPPATRQQKRWTKQGFLDTPKWILDC